MKGIVLAGGAGTRLHPATQAAALAENDGKTEYRAYLQRLIHDGRPHA